MGVSRQTISKWLSRYKRYGEESLWEIPRKKYPRAHRIQTRSISTLLQLPQKAPWTWHERSHSLPKNPPRRSFSKCKLDAAMQ